MTDINENRFRHEIESIWNRTNQGIISIDYDYTIHQQQICFVINKTRGYKVRVYVENLKTLDANRIILIAESEYITLSDANDHVYRIKQEYLINPTKFYETKFESLFDLIEIDEECLSNSDKFLKPGDHICVDRGKYHHDAIYIGNRKIIHMAQMGVSKTITKGPAHESDWGLFLDDGRGKVSIIHYKIRVFTPTQIVARAREYLTDFNDYHLVKRNCQCFASFCSTGVEHSRDIEKLRKTWLPRHIFASTAKVTAGKVEEAMRRAQAEQRKAQQHVSIIVTGASGAGKSTLINALFKVDLSEEGVGPPVTQGFMEYPKPNQSGDAAPTYTGPLHLIDTRGYENLKHNVIEELEPYIKKRNNNVDSSKHIHIALICISGEMKRYTPTDIAVAALFAEYRITTVIVLTHCIGEDTDEFEKSIEKDFFVVDRKALLDTVQSHWPFATKERDQLTKAIKVQFPSAKIDKLDPIINLINKIHPPPPLDNIAVNHENYKRHMQFMEKIYDLYPRSRLVRVLAREKQVGSKNRLYTLPVHGLSELNATIMDLLDEANRNAYATAQRYDIYWKKIYAYGALSGFVASASAIGAIPIPFSDALLLAPLELAMMSSITAIFGLPLAETVIRGVVTGVLTGAVGTVIGTGTAEIVSEFLKFIPVIGSIAGAATAGSITGIIGKLYIGALAVLVSNRKDGDPPPTTEDILKAMNAVDYDDSQPDEPPPADQ